MKLTKSKLQQIIKEEIGRKVKPVYLLAYADNNAPMGIFTSEESLDEAVEETELGEDEYTIYTMLPDILGGGI
jgi:hypothetical protein